VKGLLADVNIQGQVDLLVERMRSEPWKLFWDELRIAYRHFPEIGLAFDSPDSLVWQNCQRQELILITNNRNRHSDDSLEATIRSEITVHSLPVVTIGSVRRLHQDRDYANQVIESLLDIFLRIDTFRGTGRLYVP
jgi:hypothetical protein